MKKLSSILLIDDNPSENNYNKIIIKDMEIAENIFVVENGFDALKFLNDENNSSPDIIILDLYIPKMNGWEFIEEYKKLQLTKISKTILVILSNSSNPSDVAKAKEINEISTFELKPLNAFKLNQIIERFFKI